MNGDIFSGLCPHDATDIRHALGALNHDLGEDGGNIIGAVMSLCLTVAKLERENMELQQQINQLKKGV